MEDAYKEQSDLLNKLSSVSRGKIPVEKRSFLNKAGLNFSAREMFLIVLKVIYFQ